MAGLEDFNKVVETFKLEDFVSEETSVGVVSKASNLNMAAHVASMSPAPEQVFDNYERVAADLSETGQSEVGMELVKQARYDHMRGNRESLIEYLADPEISDELKYEAALGAVDEANEAWKLENIISTEALSADAGQETVEQEMVRVSLADQVDLINQVKHEKQRLLNAELAKSNPELLGTALDIAELIVPFVEEKFVADIRNDLMEDSMTEAVGKFVLFGQSKMDIKEMIANAPPEKQLELTKKVIDAVNQSNSIVLPTENEFARTDFLRSVLEDGYYEDGLKWLDNVIGILDTVGIGSLLGRGVKSLKATKQVSELSNARREFVRSQVQPTTLSQNYKDTNPAKARVAHEAAAADETGEAAEALYGTDRADAVANDLLPQVAKEDGSMVAKPPYIDQTHKAEVTPDAEVLEFVKSDGTIFYSEAEKISMRTNVLNDFENAVGMTARPEMFTVNTKGDGLEIVGVYGGSSRDPQDLLDMAKWSLRDYAISDDQIQLMRRVGDEYVPTTIDEINALQSVTKVMKTKGKQPRNVRVQQNQDFVVSIKHDYKFNPSDVVKWSEHDVKYNLFDRLGLFTGKGRAGSFQQHLLDAHSMLHPDITLGANVSVDRAAGLEKQLLDTGKEFADGFKKASKEHQAIMDKHIKEANEKGQGFDYLKMKADGLNEDELVAMKTWEDYWDTMYVLENRDLSKTLSARGYMEFVNQQYGTRLFAKPVPRQRAKAGVRVLDSNTGDIKQMTKEELTELYAKDGTIAHLRQPVQVTADDAVEFVISENAAGKNYLRKLQPDSQVLNYHKGYYAVKYKDPQFIVKVVKDAKGDVLYEKAVATAGSIQDADLMVRRMKAVDGGDYYRRGDVKKEMMDSDDYWDIAAAGGRSAQRVRGKRLEDASSRVSDPTMKNIYDPVESMVYAARSTAGRVEMRDYMEATKARFVQQYAEFLPKNKFGQTILPSKVGDIRHRGGVTEDSKKLGDAITTFNYIDYLDKGWINAIDDGYKVLMKGMADIAGNAGVKSIEKAGHWFATHKTPSAFAKNLAFQMYLALNPIRQFVVQSHQAVQLFAAYPRSALAVGKGGQLKALIADGLGIIGTKGHEEVIKQWKRSGLAAAVDKNNLINGSLTDMAHGGYVGVGAVGAARKTAVIPRKLGFDAGENINLMTAWLTIRDDFVRRGMKLDNTNLDKIAALARNYTYNMNKAGDLPYNQNMLNVVMQFMQVPHKAMTQMLFNRVLTPTQKLRMGVFNTMMYSLPPTMMYSLLGDVLPDDAETREALVQGMEGVMLNKMVELASGEESRIDFGNLSPVDPYGFYETIHGIMTTDAGAIVAASPSGQMLFGNNPRISNFFRSVARWTNLVDDYENPTDFGMVAKDFAKLSSGLSNHFKSQYALKYGLKIGSTGGITDPSVTRPEAIAALLGFGTLDEAYKFSLNRKTYEKSKAFKDDVSEWYTQLKQHLNKQGVSNQERDFAAKVLGEAWRVWGNDNYEARKIIAQKLQRDIQNDDLTIYKQLLKMTGFMNADELKVLVKEMPNISEEKRSELLGTIQSIQSYKDED